MLVMSYLVSDICHFGIRSRDLATTVLFPRVPKFIRVNINY
jgi:hypothetical protein